MKNKGRRWVSVYEVQQAYGGAEEGGWYYYITTHLYSIKVSSRKSARHIKEKIWNSLSEYEKRHTAIYTENSREIGQEDNSQKPKPIYC